MPRSMYVIEKDLDKIDLANVLLERQASYLNWRLGWKPILV